MMTEKEADKKSCPATFGRCGGGFGWCIASGCMAWRWSDGVMVDGQKVGFCGLAGRP